MSLIPPSFFEKVIALGVPGSDGSVQYTATGFLYGYPIEKEEKGRQEYWVFLVTNRHVIKDATKLWVRFNVPIGAHPKLYPLPMGNAPGATHWTVHPDSKVDVAVLVIDAIDITKIEEGGIKMSFFQGDVHAASLEELRASKFSEGNEIFVLGYPLGLAGDKQNYVVVRQGIVARIRDWYASDSNFFLIDSSIFPGNSGGPVISKPTLHTYGKAVVHAELIGMVSGYLPYRDIAWSRQTGRPKLISEENSGLAEVVPIDAIQETISIAVANYMKKKAASTSEGKPD